MLIFRVCSLLHGGTVLLANHGIAGLTLVLQDAVPALEVLNQDGI
jgi:hypothetical protein